MQLLSFLQVYSLLGFYELKRVRIFREGHPLRCEVTLRRKLQDWTGLKAKDKIFRNGYSRWIFSLEAPLGLWWTFFLLK